MPAPLKEFPVAKEYEKNPDLLPTEIAKLREWVDTQPHLPGNLLTEQDLVLVYHCCEYSMQVSKEVLDLHLTLRTLFTVFFKDRAMDQKAEFNFNTVLYAALPTPSVFGYKVIYVRLLDPDPRNFFFNEVARNFMMVFDLLQYEEGTWPGFVVAIDMDKAVLGHITRLEVMTLKKVLYFVQECMLVKLKEVHFTNAPPFMDKLMMLLKPFLKKALLSIIYIHPVGTDTFYDYVTRDSLPKNDGGLYKDHDTIRDETIARMQSNPEYFREENKRRVDESRRAGGRSAAADEFGLQGSFKKLDID